MHDGLTFSNRPLSGRLKLGHINTDSGAQAYVHDPTQTGDAFRLYYVGEHVVSLSQEPQQIHVNLKRRNRSPALTGQYLVDLTNPTQSPDSRRPFDQTEVFVHEGRQSIPPGQLLGFAQAPLLRAALSNVCLNVQPQTSPESPATCGTNSFNKTDLIVVDETCDAPQPQSPSALLDRLSPAQRASFQRLWDEIPPPLATHCV